MTFDFANQFPCWKIRGISAVALPQTTTFINFSSTVRLDINCEDNYTGSCLDVNALFELGWNHFQPSLLSPNVSTAWQYTFNDIVGKLSKLLPERSLPISSEYLSFEAAGHAAIYLTRKHLINYPNNYCQSMALDEIESRLYKFNQY